MKANRYTLKKIEKVLEEAGYQLRYEKGHFQSGYCIVENKNMIIINKFFDVEGRVHSLMEILEQLNLESMSLSPKSKKLLIQMLAEKID